MKKIYISYKKKISISMLIIFIPFLLVLLVISSLYTVQIIHEEQSHIESNIISSLTLINESYNMLERAIEDQTKDAFTLLNNKYLAAENDLSKLDLFSIKKELNDNMDIYIIDKGVITYTTYPSDLGLDFKKWPVFYKSLESLKQSGEYHSDSFNFENSSGELRKYSYQSSPDKKYIFELSYSSDKFKQYITVLNPNNILASLCKTFGMLDQIVLYNSKGLNLMNPELTTSESTQKIITTVINDDITYEVKDFFKDTKFLKIKLVNNRAQNVSRVAELHYNNNKIIFLILTQIIVIILGILFCTYFVVKVSEKISEPLYSLSLNVKKIISNNNYNSKTGIRSRDEFGDLSEHFDTLLDKLNENYISVVKVLANAIEASDEYTRGHCDRVEKLSTLIANKLYLKRNQRENLKIACILHDIGKIGIPNEIINKPEKLNEEEFNLIKQHPLIGYKMIKDVKFLSDSAEILLQHHERIDGKGYPSGLTGEKIMIESKILCIADSIDAMTSARVYRGVPLNKGELIFELKKNRGTQFDEEITDLVLRELKLNPHFYSLLYHTKQD